MSHLSKKQVYTPPVAEAVLIEFEPCMGDASNTLQDMEGNPIYDELFY